MLWSSAALSRCCIKAELITSRRKAADWNRPLHWRDRLQSVHVCQLVRTQLSIPHSGDRKNIKLQNMTELALSGEERKPLILSLHFTINLVEKGRPRVLRQLMMWFVTVDHRCAERIAPALNTWQSDYQHLQHSGSRLTVGDLEIISISRGTTFCSHTECCQIFRSRCPSNRSSLDVQSCCWSISPALVQTVASV